MAKKQVRRWYVRRVAKFNLPAKYSWLHWYTGKVEIGECRVAITHEGLKALERAKKGAK